MRAMAHQRVDGPALRTQLQGAGLFGADLASQAGALAAAYPRIAGRNLFAEFELGAEVVPSGFGLGLPWGEYDRYLVRDHWFLETPAGRAITGALAADPFAADNRAYLNLLSDDDPDWIEYDIAGGRIDPTPFVFFRPPSRFLNLSSPQQAGELCGLLPEAGGDFHRLLERMIAPGAIGMYRVGAAAQRGSDWWRAILTNLDAQQVGAALADLGARDFKRPIDLADEFYAGRADAPGARFALSVDVNAGRITAADVEFAYAFRVSDLDDRAAAFDALVRRLAAEGLLTPQAAAWTSANCIRQVSGPAGGLRVQLHHLKQRFFGPNHLRAKAYLHLEMVGEPTLEPAS